LREGDAVPPRTAGKVEHASRIAPRERDDLLDLARRRRESRIGEHEAVSLPPERLVGEPLDF